VTAIHLLRPWRITLVADLRLTRRALPRHRRAFETVDRAYAVARAARVSTAAAIRLGSIINRSARPWGFDEEGGDTR